MEAKLEQLNSLQQLRSVFGQKLVQTRQTEQSREEREERLVSWQWDEVGGWVSLSYFA